MIVWSPSDGPAIQPLRLLNRKIVDTRMTGLHQPVLVELPVLIPIAAPPLPRRIVTLIRKPHGNPRAVEHPQLLDQPVLQLTLPLPCQECNNRLAPIHKLRPVPPSTVDRVGERYPL